MGINWGLCCHKLCCWGANDDDGSPLLGCMRPSECTNQVHDPGCTKTLSRNLGKNGTCGVKSAEPSLSLNPSTHADMPHNQQLKNSGRKHEAENVKINIPNNSSNYLKNYKDRYSNYTQREAHRANNLSKNTGAIKKILVPKNINETDRVKSEELEISGALRHGCRQHYSETLKRGKQHEKLVDYDKTLSQKKKRTLASPKAKDIVECEKRLGAGRFQLDKSTFTNATRHSSGGYEMGCSGDSSAATHKLYATRRGKTIASKNKVFHLSKSEGDVGMWFEDEAESASITVSLTDFSTEYWDPRQLNKRTTRNYSIGSFHLEMGKIKTSNELDHPKQEGKVLSCLNDGFHQTQRATKSSTTVLLESPKNISDDSFDNLYFGIINFKVSYYHITKSLFVHIVDVKGMPPKGEHFFYDVMLMLSVLPTTKQTKNSAMVKSSDMNPYFGESFTFIVKEPKDKVLKISAYDADFQGKYNALGHSIFHLKSVTQDEMLHSYHLLREPWVDSCPGRLEVTLNYNQAANDLTVTVHRAKGLTVMTHSPHSRIQSISPERYDSFAEVMQFCGDIELKVKRTCTVINSRDPQYNSSFVFNVSSRSSHENFVVISVRLESLPKESELGRVIFGPLRFASGLTPTPWGLAFSQNQAVKSWYKMYA